jgi:CRP/FNR family cyclic AMP-dependent transcriptional regulator
MACDCGAAAGSLAFGPPKCDFPPVADITGSARPIREDPLALQPISPHIPRFEEFLLHCSRRRYPARSTLIHAGDTCDTLYYIIKGSATVLIEDDDGREIIVAYLNTGDFFGELGLFDQQDRSAGVRTKVECEIAEISYAGFRELVQRQPDFLFSLSKQLAKRLRDTTR